METSLTAIKCTTVEISDSMLCEVDDGKTISSIPREQVQAIKLVCDTGAKHPFMQFFVGFSALAVSIFGLFISLLVRWRGLLPVTVHPGQVSLHPVTIALYVLLGAGLWCLLGVLRVRYYLEVRTGTRLMRLFFERSASAGDIRQFIRSVTWRFGYEIDASALDKMKSRS